MESNNQKIIHDFNNQNEKGFYWKNFIMLVFLAVILGIGTGFLIPKIKKTTSLSRSKIGKTTQSAGVTNKKNFKDQAEGILREGGTDGEGNFHLQRPGGSSQNVYLTSTTVDLSQFIGKKVKVWGETFQAEKAGWLMDVGLVEVVQ